MRIYEAASEVLAASKTPMHAKDIYAEIVRRELYAFGAKNPVSVLTQALGERSVGNVKGKDEVFKRIGPGIYALASSDINIGEND